MADSAILLDQVGISFASRQIRRTTTRPSSTPATCDEFHYLYQCVTALRAGEILANNGEIRGPSSWGTERAAQRRGEQLRAGDRVLLRVELRRFAGESLGVDDDALAEPLRYKLHLLEPLQDTIHAKQERTRWEQSEGSWQDSLRIYESVRYEAPLRITEADVMA